MILTTEVRTSNHTQFLTLHNRSIREKQRTTTKLRAVFLNSFIRYVHDVDLKEPGRSFSTFVPGDLLADSCAFLTWSRSFFNWYNLALRLAAVSLMDARRVSVRHALRQRELI